jgi:hypothetical protein
VSVLVDVARGGQEFFQVSRRTTDVIKNFIQWMFISNYPYFYNASGFKIIKPTYRSLTFGVRGEGSPHKIPNVYPLALLIKTNGIDNMLEW